MEIKDGILYRKKKDPLVLSEREMKGIEAYIKLLLVGRAVQEITKQ